MTSLKNSWFLQKTTKYWLPVLMLATAAFTVVVVNALGSPPSIPAVNLSNDPLYAAAIGDKPAMALSLSVEFPTVGAQYLSGSYSNINEYLGYYDAESCYTYNNTPTETVTTGFTTADYKRFDKTGAAVSRMCTNAFSGNFLNWSSSSAIDMLRLALSGGDRYIDTSANTIVVGTSTVITPALTILQRAVVPNGDPVCMWNTGNFPSKQLPRSGGTSGSPYYGAIPTIMQTAAGTNDVFVANTLNRIYFGTSSGGGCGNTGSYTLGGATTGATSGPVVSMPSGTTLPADASGACAAENQTCNFTGIKEVWYGADTRWKVAPASSSIGCNNAVFGDPASGTAKNCYTRPYIGTWTPLGGAGLNSDGYFFARVQVCNKSTVAPSALLDTRDYDFCTQYPNGNYKPTGAIQKYSDQLRIGAFGYLMDQTASSSGGRYGGVLRAPIKFVGAKTFNESGADNTPGTGNPNAEWDLITGVFKSNPDNDTTQTVPISGVINYLNKFGRTGPVAGRYKIYDSMGEQYGEALRYLQGLGPTPEAINSITPAMSDGFPVYTAWADPYGGTRTNANDYSCLKSNIVTVGDVNTWDSSRLLTRTSNAASNIQDFAYWKSVVSSFEANSAVSYIDGQGATRTTGNPNVPNNNSQTSASGNQVLTGQAYWAHTHDIRGIGWTSGSGPSLQRPGLRVKSFFFDVNENNSSSDSSYRQNKNQYFTAAKYGGFESDPSNVGSKPSNTYGNPFKKQDGTNNNDVWQDPLNPGEAGTYYLSSSARGTLSSFDNIFKAAATSARSIAAAAVSGESVTVGNTVYQAAFDTSDWTGDVLAFPISYNTTTAVVSVATTAAWSAATRLNAMASPATTRKIVVGRVGTAPNPTATDFNWANIDVTLQTDLAKLSPSSTPDTLGQDRLNFLRGDRSKEGGAPFRTRGKLLGDIVNSGVVYVGNPTTPNFSEGGFSAFSTANSGRTKAVYSGANDGILHAFNAATGDELFGYIPSAMGPKLAALTSPSFNNNHQTYVDATPVIKDAHVGAGSTAADWKTVLVSGMGGGASGVFALDVTNPAAFGASKVMWEFTRADDPDMGYVVGRPQIVKLRTSAYGAAPTYKWYAIVASGVNNYVPDAAGNFSTTGNPALFLLSLDKSPGTAWSAANYYKISLPVDTTLSITNATGLVNFSTQLGLSGEVAQIFMGDLHGKVWKLDFSLRGNTEWSFNKLNAYNKGTAAMPIPYPLYSAKTAAGVIQPITSSPVVGLGPSVGGIDTFYVAFGTGKYLEVSDKTSTAQNSFYAVYDNGLTGADSSPAGDSVVSGRGRLQAASSTSGGTITVPPFIWGRPPTDTNVATRAGWYFDFPATGEKQISNPKLFLNNLNFCTLIPASSGGAGSCLASGGGGNCYDIDIVSGKGKYLSCTSGLCGEPLLLDIPSVDVTKSSGTGRATKVWKKAKVVPGSNGVAVLDPSLGTTATQRMSWRQIHNYQDLKAAP